MRSLKKARATPTIHLAITGGGTGGHVYPGIAVAKELQRLSPEARILFIGTQTGLEARIVPHEGFPLEAIEVKGFKSRGMRHKMRALALVPRAVVRSMTLLRRFRATVIVGTGGYVSVPVIYAASLLRIPAIILEPNRQPGLANRLLSKTAKKIAISFEETAALFPAKKVVLTGNPVRREFFVVGDTPPPDKGRHLNILVLGGSLGARSINYSMIKALDYLEDLQEHLRITHQTGNADFEYVNAGYQQKGFQAEVAAFFHDLPKVYAKAHLIICRAGATTVAELKASGRPAILIPYPHGDRHQEFNALALKDAGLAKILLQRQLSGQSLANEIRRVIQYPEELAQVWPNTGRPVRQDAAEQIVRLCFQLALGKEPDEMAL